MISIVTPTYNRAWALPRLASSLEAQGSADFEWIVVDDGSFDDTESLLSRIEREGRLPLRWFRVQNGGKHRAVNSALRMVRGDWVFIVDSDDALPPSSLELVERIIDRIDSDASIGGIMGLKADFSGCIVGKPLPKHRICMNAVDITFRAKIRGDKAEIFRAELLRSFPFPEFKGETFITECVTWFRIASAGYRLALVNEPLYLCEYLADGLSANSLRLRLDNPQGTMLFYREELGLDLPSRLLWREAINFGRFALHFGGLAGYFSEVLRLESPRRILAIAALPVALAVAWLDKARHPRR